MTWLVITFGGMIYYFFKAIIATIILISRIIESHSNGRN